jgi:hypothetical protein
VDGLELDGRNRGGEQPLGQRVRGAAASVAEGGQ